MWRVLNTGTLKSAVGQVNVRILGRRVPNQQEAYGRPYYLATWTINPPLMTPKKRLQRSARHTPHRTNAGPGPQLPSLDRPMGQSMGRHDYQRVFSASSVQGILMLGDMAAVAMCLTLTIAIPWLPAASFVGPFIALSISVILGMYVSEAYEARVYREHSLLRSRLLIALSLSGVVAGAMAFLIPAAGLTRSAVPGLYLIALPVFGIWRLGLAQRLHRHFPPRRVAVVGSGPAASELIGVFSDASSHELAMIVASDPSGDLLVSSEGIPTRRIALEQLPDVVADDGISVLAVTLPAGDRGPLYRQLLACRYLGIEVQDVGTCFEMLCQRLSIRYLEDSWVIFASRFPGWDHGFAGKRKRMLDVAVAGVGLLIASPFMMIVALAICTTSRGPALFRQDRIGLRGKPYTILKFRSMCVDAEPNGAKWAQEDDPRSTWLGAWLRKAHLDELPQLLNVLWGDMTLVGPRPERPEFVEQLRQQIPYYDLRHMVKPGITGWAQVRCPYAASVDDAATKLEYDLYYILHKSSLWDLRIILRTFTVVFARRGSR